MTGRERLIPYAFLLPALALIVIFNLFPTIATLIESLHGNSLLRGVLLFVLVADTVANFLLFAPVLLLTRGGRN